MKNIASFHITISRKTTSECRGNTMKYVTPKYEMSVVEAEDIVTSRFYLSSQFEQSSTNSRYLQFQHSYLSVDN